MKFELLSVDCIAYDDGWTWNDVSSMGLFETNARDVVRAVRNALKRRGADPRGLRAIDSDFYIEFVDRDERTVFAARYVEI